LLQREEDDNAPSNKSHASAVVITPVVGGGICGGCRCLVLLITVENLENDMLLWSLLLSVVDNMGSNTFSPSL